VNGFVSPGSNVLYGKFDGMKVEYNGEAHVLIRDDDVLLTWDGPTMTEETVKTVRDRLVGRLVMSDNAVGCDCGVKDKGVVVVC